MGAPIKRLLAPKSLTNPPNLTFGFVYVTGDAKSSALRAPVHVLTHEYSAEILIKIDFKPKFVSEYVYHLILLNKIRHEI